MTPRSLISLSELAATLGVDERTAARWARSGRIPSYRAGRQWRFDAAEVLAALRFQPTGENADAGKRRNRPGQGDHCVVPGR